MRVCPDDLRERRGLRLVVEDVELVCAEQRDLPLLEQSVPELLERDRGGLVSSLKEKVDHLAESSDRPPGEAARDLLGRRADHLLEAGGRGQLALPERSERLVRVVVGQETLLLELVEFPPAALELVAERLLVASGRDHERRLARAESGVEEPPDRDGELVEFAVDLHPVPGRRSTLEERRPVHCAYNVPGVLRVIPGSL